MWSEEEAMEGVEGTGESEVVGAGGRQLVV